MARRDPDVAESLERANAGVVPTVRLGVRRGCVLGGEPEPLDPALGAARRRGAVLDALARLHGAGGLCLGDGTRFIGTFRAHGLLVPVWDLPTRMRADDIEDLAARRSAGGSTRRWPSGRCRRASAMPGPGCSTRQLTLR